MTEIAFLGLGTMGRGMVRNLLRAGHDVTVWNRTPQDPGDDLAKAKAAATIADAVAGKPVIALCLTGPEAQRAVYEGEGGLLAHAAPGSTVIDATTTDPEVTVDLFGQGQARAVPILDCPVFGSKGEAWDGRLDFVCGGPPAAFDGVKPVLEAMAATVHYLGPTGSGARMKLVGNLLVAAQMASLGEALSLARKSGLDPDAVMGVLDVTDFSSGLIRGVGRASLAGAFEPFFYLRHMLKDARLIGAFAKANGVPVPNAGQIAEAYQAAVNRGLGDLNASALHKLQFEAAGLEADPKDRP